MSMLIPIAVVVVIGLVAGIILTIASKLMFVPVDEVIASIREALPGANCGACGYAGCDDYAAALGEDPDKSLSTALCPVGGPDLAVDLAGILGVEVDDAEPKTAMVMCNGTSGVAKQIMEYSRIGTCKAATQFYGGQWACAYGCLGLGDCAIACPYDAIKVSDGLARVDRDKCIGCGLCAKVCPKHIISIQNKKNLVYVACTSNTPGAATRKRCTVGCIGCMKCQKVCKFDAIFVENNLARVDFNKCVNCGLCEKECPTKAIINLRPKKIIKSKTAVEAKETVEA
ncbi:MAG: RnfABCDGE type electron transport complex subunit B [Anaerovoracaceae bacterium]